MISDPRSSLRKTFLTIFAFAVAFAFVEAAVVVYLRSLYYPDGFSFPLRLISEDHILVEIAREASTIVMLITAGVLAGRTRWGRMAWFMIAFGVWDIFYYVWLKVMLDWPSSLVEWDVLFLIPVPWIGPVIAPIVVSLFLIGGGALIVSKENSGAPFHPTKAAWWLSSAGTLAIVGTFVMDTDATFNQAMPAPYLSWLFLVGILCYSIALFKTWQQ